MQKIPDFMTRNVQVVADVATRHQGRAAAALRRICDPSMPDRPAA